MSYNPNYLSQQDPEWKKEKLGFSNLTIGSDGCTLTCLTMMVNGFGYAETPKSLNKKLKGLGANSGFIGPLVVWGGLPLLFPQIKYRNLILCRDYDAPLSEIDTALAKGQPVIVEVDRSLSQGLQNHWVVLYAKKGDDYLMTDPWPYPSDNKDTLLSVRYGFGRSVKKTITAVVWYEMQGMAPPPPDDEGMYVQVAEAASAGLRLRDQPTTASNTLALEPAGTYLKVIEDEETAQAKLGVTGQWLQVRDPQGVEGYVAAWYVDPVVSTLPNPNPDPIPDPAPDPEPDPDPEPIPDPEPEPDPDTLKVYVDPAVGSSGLRMRATPRRNGRLVTVLKAKTEVTVIEDANEAEAKIGVENKWINVKDGKGNKGYVAAWFIVASLEPEPEPEPIPDPAPDPEPEPDPTSMSVIVFPSLGSSGLRMRAQPSLGGRLLTVLKGGTKLTVLEDAEGARAKIGVKNQWLHVRNPAGVEGYTAAWYVNEDTAAPAPDPDPSPQPDVLTVFVMPLASRGLRMRSGPSTGNSIIKTLMPNSKLTVLEPFNTAAAKVGASGKWLHVRDAAGEEGYVAAWYVIR